MLSDNTLKVYTDVSEMTEKAALFQDVKFFFILYQWVFYLLLCQHKPTGEFYYVTKPGSVILNQEVKYSKCTKSWHPEIETKYKWGLLHVIFFFSDAVLLFFLIFFNWLFTIMLPENTFCFPELLRNVAI